MRNIERRGLLKGLLALGVGLGVGGCEKSVEYGERVKPMEYYEGVYKGHIVKINHGDTYVIMEIYQEEGEKIVAIDGHVYGALGKRDGVWDRIDFLVDPQSNLRNFGNQKTLSKIYGKIVFGKKKKDRKKSEIDLTTRTLAETVSQTDLDFLNGKTRE